MRTQYSTRSMTGLVALLTAVVAGCTIPGCSVGPTALADGSRAASTNAVGSVTRSADEVGTWEQVNTTADGTQIAADANGLTQITTGPHRTMAVGYGDVRLALTDPLDGSLKGLRITLEDGTSIELDEFMSTPSRTIAARNDQVIAALRATERISEAQAAAIRAAVEAGADLAVAIADVLATP